SSLCDTSLIYLHMCSWFHSTRAFGVPQSCPTRRSSDLAAPRRGAADHPGQERRRRQPPARLLAPARQGSRRHAVRRALPALRAADRKSTRLNSSHVKISYAVFCLKKNKQTQIETSKT